MVTFGQDFACVCAEECTVPPALPAYLHVPFLGRDPFAHGATISLHPRSEISFATQQQIQCLDGDFDINCLMFQVARLKHFHRPFIFPFAVSLQLPDLLEHDLVNSFAHDR